MDNMVHCHSEIVNHGNILFTLGLAGLAGSFAHCAGMCGPFVMTQTVARLENMELPVMSEWKRLQGAALLPYHLGRITTYVFLGFLVSFFAQGVIRFSGFEILNAVLLALAGLLFLLSALQNTPLAHWQPRFYLFSGLTSRLSVMTQPFFSRPEGAYGYILGLMLGFLPCGLLYSALMVASTASPVAAVAGMAAFGFGTIPALFVVSYGSLRVGGAFKQKALQFGRFIMIVNGAMLLFWAGQKLM